MRKINKQDVLVGLLASPLEEIAIGGLLVNPDKVSYKEFLKIVNRDNDSSASRMYQDYIRSKYYDPNAWIKYRIKSYNPNINIGVMVIALTGLVGLSIYNKMR